MAEKKELRWKQRFQNFEKAYRLLERTLNIKNPSEAERGGLIQFYEMAFDLSWKLIKDYLDEQGFNVQSPREAFKQGFQLGIIENGQTWIEALEDRNLTTHTYDEGAAKKVIATIRSDYFPILKKMYQRLKTEI